MNKPEAIRMVSTIFKAIFMEIRKRRRKRKLEKERKKLLREQWESDLFRWRKVKHDDLTKRND